MTEPARQLLVIDDDILVRQSIVAYLEDSGYRVHGEPNGYLGMDWFRQHNPDLVLTDLRMPGMDGLELLGCGGEAVEEKGAEQQKIVEYGVGGERHVAGPRALVRVAHTQNHAGFRGDGWEILTRLTEGPYPQWRQVVPQDNNLVLTADRVTLMAAVRRMAIFADDKTHRIRLSLSGSTLAFSAWSSGVGTGSEEIAVDYVGEPLEIGFNALYLLDVLKYISTGEVKLTFKAPERAATLHPVGGDGVIEKVQFHPAYSYEEFIQGIRPQRTERGELHGAIQA